MFLVEQPVQVTYRRQRGIEHLVVGARRHQHHRAPPWIVAIVGWRHNDIAIGDTLQHQPGSAPTGLAGRFFGNPVTGEHDGCVELLRLAKIMLCTLGQRFTFERDHALVAVHFLALVDREGEIAFTDQRAHRLAVGLVEPRFIETGIAAQVHRCRCAFVGIGIDDEQVDRTITLDLKAEDTVELERRGQRRGQRQRLAEQARDRVRIVMSRQDLVDQRPKPCHAAVQQRPIRTDPVYLEGLDEVVTAERVAIKYVACGHALFPAPKVPPRHQLRMLFCACRRFSASSQTTDCGPSMTAVGNFVATMGRKAVHENRVGLPGHAPSAPHRPGKVKRRSCDAWPHPCRPWRPRCR